VDSVTDCITGAGSNVSNQVETSWNQGWAELGLPQIAIVAPIFIVIVIYVLFHIEREQA